MSRAWVEAWAHRRNNFMEVNDMEAKTYQVTLTGATPLLMHRDSISWDERVKAWTRDPIHRKESEAGDDRTPAWKWLGCLYHDGERLVMDADNLMAMLRDGGTKCPAKKGRGSLKAATQSGILVNEIGWPLLVGGAEVPCQGLFLLQDETDFSRHEEVAEAMGFSLFVKRARIGTSKHIRVRPRFDSWACSGTVTLLDPQISGDVLSMVLTTAGLQVGLGDWRPGSPSKPGQFGRFSAEVKAL